MSNLRIAELDFDQIKTNLKTFLKNQSEFSDYDFEGSGLSVLLDTLAYNTHYNAYLANMLVNEMFLDSSVKRSSAVSIAKHLGYTPVSVRGAIANLDVVVNNVAGLPATLTMDRYTPFTSSIDGTAYTFLSTETKTVGRVGTSYTFTDVNVLEGSLFNYNHVVTDTSTNAKYEIPSDLVDTTSLLITVQTSSSDLSSSVYTLSTDTTGIDGNSKVYFLEQNPKGRYQIYFGDGILGKKLSSGNIIIINYIVSSGKVANVSNTIDQTFAASTGIGGSTDITIAVNSNSTGGADAEGITSIKFNAPRVNASKNRAVTAADYESLILANYTGAESISVWGGEDNVPPIYGRVLISLKPYSGYAITEATKNQIKNSILKSKQVLAITPQFIDPEYIFVNVTASVNYNSSLTTLSAAAIKNQVIDAINSYFTTYLQKFNKSYNNSKLITQTLQSNPAIDSVVVTLKIQKREIPVLNAVNVFTGDSAIRFRNPIKPGEIASSYFYINVNGVQTLCKIKDAPNEVPYNYQGSGVLSLVNTTTGSTVIANIGTVNYASGLIEISGITPTSLPTGVTDIRITAAVQEAYYNITTSRNEILILDDTTYSAIGGLDPGLTVTATPIV